MCVFYYHAAHNETKSVCITYSMCDIYRQIFSLVYIFFQVMIVIELTDVNTVSGWHMYIGRMECLTSEADFIGR